MDWPNYSLHRWMFCMWIPLELAQRELLVLTKSCAYFLLSYTGQWFWGLDPLLLFFHIFFICYERKKDKLKLFLFVMSIKFDFIFFPLTIRKNKRREFIILSIFRQGNMPEKENFESKSKYIYYYIKKG